MSDLSLMIVAGERSGDILGAELARALHERLADLKLFGCGGDAMREAGVDTVVDAHRLTMMGITEVDQRAAQGLPSPSDVSGGSGSASAAACGAHRFSRLQPSPGQAAQEARTAFWLESTVGFLPASTPGI